MGDEEIELFVVEEGGSFNFPFGEIVWDLVFLRDVRDRFSHRVKEVKEEIN